MKINKKQSQMKVNEWKWKEMKGNERKLKEIKGDEGWDQQMQGHQMQGKWKENEKEMNWNEMSVVK